MDNITRWTRTGMKMVRQIFNILLDFIGDSKAAVTYVLYAVILLIQVRATIQVPAEESTDISSVWHKMGRQVVLRHNLLAEEENITDK